MNPLTVSVDADVLGEMIHQAVEAEIDARDLTGDISVGVGRAAEMLDCSSSTIRSLVGRGVLPKVPEMGNRVLIPVLALKAHAMKNAAA